MQKKNIKIIFLFCLISFTAIAAYEVFNGLAMSGEIIEWDEARHGVNAYEMVKSGNYIVNTFQYRLDYWNVKPPLSMWQIAAAYKIFGFNTFALRFFSALYLPVTVFVSMLVLFKYQGLICAAVTGFLFAVSASRFPHLFKSGDPDSLFFFLCFMTCLFLYAAYGRKTKLLIGAGLCVALAFLAKGMHVVSLLAVIAAYAALSLKNRKLGLKNIIIYLVAPMAAPVIIWAALRARYDGLEFFKQMFILDVFNRVTTVVENHTGGWAYYFRGLYAFLGPTVVFGLFLLILLLLFNRLTQKNKIKQDAVFLTVFIAMALAPLVIFTLSTTKITWYMYPCVIGIYFLVGYVAKQIAAGIDAEHIKAKQKAGEIISLAFCLAVLMAGGFIKPFNVNVNYMTTDVTSHDGIFTKISEMPGDKFIVVNSQGQKDELLNSWLLHSYYSGPEYIPQGIESLGDYCSAFIILKHGDNAQLESFRALYPQFTAAASCADYTGMLYTVLY